MNLRTIIGISLACYLSFTASALQAAPNTGKISGVVLDPSGTAQMGATVLVTSQQLFNSSQLELLTNDRGRFSTSALPEGLYTVKVTLAGFLPAMQQNIQVSDQRTTVLQVMLGSVLSSFEKLRQQPNEKAAKDDWMWALRSSAATRSVMQYQDPAVTVAGQTGMETAPTNSTQARLLLSSGGGHPGSVGALADSPGTGFVYDMGTQSGGQLLMAGHFSTERGASAASFAGEWLPSGKVGVGPMTTLVVRQSQLGPVGPTFRGLRMSHEDQLALSDNVTLRYGSELLVTSLMSRTTTAIRPRGEVDVKLGHGWQAASIVATRPWGNRDNGTPTAMSSATGTGMDSALNALDGFPTVLMRHGTPLTEDDVHEEFSISHSAGRGAQLAAAVFHDSSNHTAVIGRGGAAGAPDFLQDYFSQAFAYDGGNSSSTGARVAYLRKLSDTTDISAIYAYGDVLAPGIGANGKALRSQLTAQGRHSIAARTSTKIPHLGTNVTTSYKWVNGTAVSRLDAYGESLYRIDPYLSVQIRQPVPALLSGRLEIEADAGNLLGQGYVPVATNRGQVMLVSAYRYYRGGLSFQF